MNQTYLAYAEPEELQEWTDPRAPFLAAIQADPRNVINHLVFADWLEENGEQEEADFRRKFGQWFGDPVLGPDPPHELLTGGRWQLRLGFGGDFPRWLDDSDVEHWDVSMRRADVDNLQDRAYRNGDKYLSWRTFKEMEEGLRRAYYRGLTRKAQNPEQLSRYAGQEPTFGPQDEYGRPLTGPETPDAAPGPEKSENIPDFYPEEPGFAVQDGQGAPNPPLDTPSQSPVRLDLPQVSPGQAPEARPEAPQTPTEAQVSPIQDEMGFAPAREVPVDHARLGDSFADAFAHYEQEDDRANYTQAVYQMAQRLPRWAQERLATGGRLQKIQSYKSPEDVRTAWEALGEERGSSEPEGFYDPDTGTVVVNDVDPVGAFAHETAHALDWDPDAISPKGEQGHYTLSGTVEWNRAWREEIFRRGLLSQYGRFDPTEGFAEFYRAVMAYPQGRELAAREMPMCFAYFASIGLV